MNEMTDKEGLGALVLGGPLLCVIYKAAVSKDSHEAWTEMQNQYGYEPAVNFKKAILIAFNSTTPLTALDRISKAMCRYLGELVAMNPDILNDPGRCNHTAAEHIVEFIRLDDYFGGLIPGAPQKSSVSTAAGRRQLFNKRDLKFLREMQISVGD